MTARRGAGGARGCGRPPRSAPSARSSRDGITLLPAVVGALDRVTAQPAPTAIQRSVAQPEAPQDGITLLGLERLLQKPH